MVKLVPNTDRLDAQKPSDRAAFEARMLTLIQEMDQSFFGGAAHITGVKLAHFAHDYRYNGAMITLGLFNSETNVIYLNRHLKSFAELGQHIEDLQAVLWHELCHAVLINAHQQLRHGMYNPCGGDHGDDFNALVARNPRFERVLNDGAIEHLSNRIAFRMMIEGGIKLTQAPETDPQNVALANPFENKTGKRVCRKCKRMLPPNEVLGGVCVNCEEADRS
jgi:hypothetical protein